MNTVILRYTRIITLAAGLLAGLVEIATAQTVTLVVNNLSNQNLTFTPQLTLLTPSGNGTATLTSGTAKPQKSEARMALDEGLIFERTQAVVTKRQQSQMLIAKARNELILKDLVEAQAGYILVSFRQRLLMMPVSYGRRILNISDPKHAREILKEMAHELLNELKDFPQRISDLNWGPGARGGAFEDFERGRGEGEGRFERS